jgi:hypothetical protein
MDIGHLLERKRCLVICVLGYLLGFFKRYANVTRNRIPPCVHPSTIHGPLVSRIDALSFWRILSIAGTVVQKTTNKELTLLWMEYERLIWYTINLIAKKGRNYRL